MTPEERAGVLQAWRDARDLLSDQSRWTTDFLATDDEGSPRSPHSPFACRWCVVGALMKVTPTIHLELAATIELAGYLPHPGQVDITNTGLARLNDQGGHQAVLALLDRAIADLAATHD